MATTAQSRWVEGKTVERLESVTYTCPQRGRVRDFQRLRFTDGSYLWFVAHEGEDDHTVWIGYAPK